MIAFQAADRGKERHLGSRGSKSSRHALPDQRSNLSGDVSKISVWMNGVCVCKKLFCRSRNNWLIGLRPAIATDVGHRRQITVPWRELNLPAVELQAVALKLASIDFDFPL
jgi:hypothetical protein